MPSRRVALDKDCDVPAHGREAGKLLVGRAVLIEEVPAARAEGAELTAEHGLAEVTVAAALAIEALLAFFMESTFLGIWIFGEGRVPEKVHLASIWLVAIGSNLSALWILFANGWTQHPVGYVINEANGRA